MAYNDYCRRCGGEVLTDAW